MTPEELAAIPLVPEGVPFDPLEHSFGVQPDDLATADINGASNMLVPTAGGGWLRAPYHMLKQVR